MAIEQGGDWARTTFANWDLVSGVRLPRKLVYRDPSFQQALTWELERVEPFKDAPFPAMHGRVDWHLPEGLDSVTLPLSLYQGRWIMVPVTLGNIRSIFLLDTGASATVISISLAKKLGLPLKGTLAMAAGIFSGVYFVHAPAMEIGGARVDPQTIVALDLDGGEFGATVPGIGGIVGYDFLSRFVTVVDYQGGKITFSPVSSFSPSADDVAIPVELDAQDLMLPVEVNGKSAKFILDTGNGSGIVVQRVANQKSWVTAEQEKRWYDPKGERFGSGIAGAWRAYVDFSVGPFRWSRAPVSIVDETSAKGTSLGKQGNVGVGLLRHFRVSVDMATPRLWLSQQVPFRDRPSTTTFGFSLSPKGEDVVVQSMDVDGPAARSGLRVGEVVKSINGMDARRVLPHLSPVLADALPGEQVHLAILREGKVLNVNVAAELVP